MEMMVDAKALLLITLPFPSLRPLTLPHPPTLPRALTLAMDTVHKVLDMSEAPAKVSAL